MDRPGWFWKLDKVEKSRGGPAAGLEEQRAFKPFSRRLTCLGTSPTRFIQWESLYKVIFGKLWLPILPGNLNEQSRREKTPSKHSDVLTTLRLFRTEK